MGKKTVDRVVRLVVDGEGDVVLARFDHSMNGEPQEVYVEWPGFKRNNKPLRVITLSYRFKKVEP